VKVKVKVKVIVKRVLVRPGERKIIGIFFKKIDATPENGDKRRGPWCCLTALLLLDWIQQLATQVTPSRERFEVATHQGCCSGQAISPRPFRSTCSCLLVKGA
jgi:hypothetical protein